MKSFVDALVKEINTTKNPDNIDKLELNISAQIEETVNCEVFFDLPISNILNIAEKADLSNIDEPVKFIKSFISKTVAKHLGERETLCLLYSFHTNDIKLDYQEILHIFQLFQNSQICNQLGSYLSIPEIDFEYRLNQKDLQINQLNDQIKFISRNSILTKEPPHFQPNIFKAITDGDLPSVQYHIYKDKIYPDPENDDMQMISLFAFASNQFDIFQFLFELFQFPKEVLPNFMFAPLISTKYFPENLFLDEFKNDMISMNKMKEMFLYCKKPTSTFLPFYKFFIEEKKISEEILFKELLSILEHSNPYIIPIITNDMESFLYFNSVLKIPFDVNDSLFLSCLFGIYDMTKYILEHYSFDINLYNWETLLQISCTAWPEKKAHAESLQNIKYLLNNYKININYQNEEGDTALHIAMMGEYDEAAAFLISKGADQNIKNKRNKIPNQVQPQNFPQLTSSKCRI